MRTIEISPNDAAQVRAIMNAFAEMSDQNAMQSEQLLGRMKHDNPDCPDLISELIEQVGDFEEDSENLKRIALLF